MDAVSDRTDVGHPRGRRIVSKSPYIASLQRRHFLFFDVVPNAVVFLAVPYHILFFPVRVSDAVTFLILWAVTGLGITVGYHRLFTHRAFKANPSVCSMLAFCGALAGQGPVISWAAIHRRHHELSDCPGDPHSPNLHGESISGIIRGLLHSHYTWMLEHDYPNAAHYVPDLLRARPIQWINRRYLQIALFGLFVPGLVCGLVTWSFFAGLSAVLWGGFIRMAFLGHTIWAINSVLHRFGSKPFATPDNSHNAGIVSLLTFGEAWHNNHHAFPTSAKFGVRHGWTDPGWWLVKSLEAAGCVAEVREPADSMIEERLREGRQYYDSE